MGLVILGIPLLIISLQQFQKRLKHNKITDIIKLTYVCLITSLICTYFYL
jgi:DMSO/TMAO reductase YedYZ heme-binding membrane subunit